MTKKLELASVLILENEELIVLDVENYLQLTGYDIAGSFSSGAAAIEWLKAHRADVALLDIMLRDGESAKVARALEQCGIPFVVHSTHTYEADVHDPVFSRTRWISKPSCPDEVIAALRYALYQSGPEAADTADHNPDQREQDVPRASQQA
ncbi:response regulator [Rhizobium deserti]|uniref:Response regulator n=1 Tax=Rhizobium deserti TaxID=2547961 RepID=A0A4R5U6P9_9HYPH|nr:response regulator [Rhizobium deserti]TDK29915.1 response regulator [Rhizobium deserti]